MSKIVSFGEWVQARRNQLRLSRTVLAQQVGCSPVTIKKIERDERRPSFQIAELLAQHLKIPEADQDNFIRRARGEFVARFGSPEEMTLAEAQAPAAEEDAPKHNLPAQTTPFFGRETELADITKLLADPNCRLLTILGAGGMGKTRLSIEVATAQIGNFTDGVTFVPLAPVEMASSEHLINPLLGALADGLNISFHAEGAPEQQMRHYLQRKEMLLVLDNFEHLLDTAVLLADLLQHAPDIKILTTSRVRLHLQEEWVLGLQGLSFPQTENQEADTFGALALFTQRAKQIKPDFDFEGEKTAVLRICQLVEGMPLGLELAAAWVRPISCAKIAKEIEAEIDFLSSNLRNVPERHRSVRAVFAYSWQQLSEQEKGVLQKLSVFRGGFEQEAAKAVAGASLRLLSGLVDKSLVAVGENGRYSIHELLRQFAEEKLAQNSAAVQATRQAHAQYFLDYVTKQKPAFVSPRLKEGLTNLKTDIDNVRTAIRWSASEDHTLFDETVAWVLIHFYELNGWLNEMADIFGMLSTQFNDACKAEPPATAAATCSRWALYNALAAHSQMRLHHLDIAEETIQASHTFVSASNDPMPWLRAFCEGMLGIVVYMKQEYRRALPHIKRAFQLYELTDDRTSQSAVAIIWIEIEQETGALESAQALAESTYQMLTDIGNNIWRGYALDCLGQLAVARGEFSAAEQYHLSSLELCQKLDNQTGVAFSFSHLGELARVRGDHQQAQVYFWECITLAREINLLQEVNLVYWLLGNIEVANKNYLAAERYFQASSHAALYVGGQGWAALGLGKRQEAERIFFKSVQRMLDTDANLIGLDAIVGIAQIKSQTGQIEQAIELLCLVQNHSASSWEIKQKARLLRDELGAELPPELVAEAEARGRELDLGETAELLLAEGADS
ncbi:MAG: helix-turn-helix domain-containing protein [Chloroflexota bacterium]